MEGSSARMPYEDVRSRVITFKSQTRGANVSGQLVRWATMTFVSCAYNRSKPRCFAPDRGMATCLEAVFRCRNPGFSGPRIHNQACVVGRRRLGPLYCGRKT